MRFPKTAAVLAAAGIDPSTVIEGSVTELGYETPITDGRPIRSDRHRWPESVDVATVIAALDDDYAALGETRPV